MSTLKTDTIEEELLCVTEASTREENVSSKEFISVISEPSFVNSDVHKRSVHNVNKSAGDDILSSDSTRKEKVVASIEEMMIREQNSLNNAVLMNESDPLENLFSKPETVYIKSETVLPSPNVNSENDFLVFKEEQIDAESQETAIKEEIDPSVANHLHTALPLSLETIKQRLSMKMLMKKGKTKHAKLYKCNLCTFQSSYLSSLKMHLRIHEGEKPYKCDFCKFEYSYLTNFKNHLRIHTGEKPYKCETCSYECSQLSHLNNHLKIHTGEKPFQCDSCSYKCSRLSSLKLHLRIHTGEKPYKCDSCSYECSQLSSLKIHSRVHTGEKPYKCDICSYECTQLSSIKIHKKTHTGEKPYKCNSCKFQSSRLSNLKVHLAIHTGEKHYSCSSCSYKCSRLSTLKRHSKIHTYKNCLL